MRSKLSVVALALSLVATAATSALAAQGWLGVTTQSTDADLRRSLDLTRNGLLVNSVSSESPAGRAGIERGDVILTYDSQPVTEPDELRQMVRETEPGRTIEVGIWRDGSRRSLDVRVGELPSSQDDSWETPVPRAPEPPSPPRAPRAPRGTPSWDDGEVKRKMYVDGRELTEEEMEEKMKSLDGRVKGLKELKDLPGMRNWSWSDRNGDNNLFGSGTSRGRLGVRVESLTDDLAQALGVEGDRGVMVVQVLEDTPAQRAGVRAGDVILRVGNNDVSDPDGLVKALPDGDGTVDILVVRKGARRTLQADLDRGRTAPRAWSSTPNGRRFNVRIPEPDRNPQVYRWRGREDAKSNEDLREELRQLRRELQELRREMGQRR